MPAGNWKASLRKRWVVASLAGCIAALAAEPRVDPAIVSVHPFAVQRGTEATVTVRGRGLPGAKAVFVSETGLAITVESVDKEPAGKTPMQAVRLRIQAAPELKPGRYPFRLITPNGVSNALPLHITEYPVTMEPDGSHESPETAIAVSSLPVVYTGRLSARGETDYYSITAKAGQTVTMEVISGLPQIAAGGSAATIPNFDPSLTLYEQAGSWLNPQRLKRIAYNDEPVFVFGKPTDGHLVHKFQRDGSYLLRLGAFAGQGGPDYSYQLKIFPGEAPQDLAAKAETWEERGYSRPLSANRLNELAERGGAKQDRPSVETYRASSANTPLFKLPGTLEGELTQRGETHRARFQLDEPRDIAMEVETPITAPPFFNPIVRLLNSAGEEVATNLFAGKGACSGALTKSLQAKAILPLRDTGAYTLEIRDATAEAPPTPFRYRLQVRPQVPHIGLVRIDADHVNLAPEEAKTIRVSFDREEDYRDGVAVSVESLPAGVQAIVGADYEADKDPPPATGKRERYTARTERAVVVLTAAADAAASTQPQLARILVRPLAGGKLGATVAEKSILVMVVAKP